MSSSVDIANLALTLMGAERITSFDDENARARAMRANYDMIRQAELRANNWCFAMERASLAALATVPLWGFGAQYQLPVDCLRVVQVSESWVGLVLEDYITSDTADYSIEGRKILTNMSAPLPIRYVKDVTDATQFDAVFVTAFAHRMAIVCCEGITQSTSKKQSLETEYLAVIGLANRVNAFEKPPQAQPDNSWIMARE
jgi:hypothetical protein